MQKLLQLESKNFEKAAHYEQKFGLSRQKFLKIFNLYSVLSFLTIFRKISQLQEQAGTLNIGL